MAAGFCRSQTGKDCSFLSRSSSSLRFSDAKADSLHILHPVRRIMLSLSCSTVSETVSRLGLFLSVRFVDWVCLDLQFSRTTLLFFANFRPFVVVVVAVAVVVVAAVAAAAAAAAVIVVCLLLLGGSFLFLFLFWFQVPFDITIMSFILVRPMRLTGG